MLYKIVFYLFDLFPRLKRWFWKKWYTLFTQKVENPNLKFMNYGYFGLERSLTLDAEDENNRFTIQLYHHVASQVNLKGLKVLEVGSGRGGGAAYIAKYLSPERMEGVDISPSAIALCNKNYKQENLTFQQGDAERLPFDDNFFDVVINVESSHCYASMEKFLNEVKRVLKPNGAFLFCDLRKAKRMDDLLKKLDTDGLKLITKKDITSNVIKASKIMTTERLNAISKFKYAWLRKILESFAAVEGSKMYKSFTSGDSKYISAHCQNYKP
ncbi:MAG: class I SAM-dependent methyltransferase [Bacteroidota bacterium]|nr:class I SAM-dependent methyltransferase [Bacteroidota bacterium]